MTLTPAALNLLSDWSVDLSAGWFAAALIAFTQRPPHNNLAMVNLLYSLAFFLLGLTLTTI